MNWHDFFYFSKGERQAFSLLLILLILALFTLAVNSKKEPEPVVENQYIVNPSYIPVRIITDSIHHKKTDTVYPKTTVRTKKKDVPRYTRTEKYPVGTIVELNTADTTILKKVPGIGSSFARRITKYRDLLGGFYSVSQLQEIYGMDDERYQAIRPWFHADTSFIAKLPVNHLSYESLIRHPYLNPKQTRAICRLRQQKGNLSGWENLRLLDEFSVVDMKRLEAYFSFGD